MRQLRISSTELDEHFKISLLDMRENGMCFHEGYLLGVPCSSFVSELKRIEKSNISFSIRSLDDLEHLPSANSIQQFECIHVTYSQKIGDQPFHYQLIASQTDGTNPAECEVEIVCDRVGITDTDNPEGAIRTSAKEFFRLHEVLKASALFLGPDTVQSPSLDGSKGIEWMRVL